MKRKMWVPPLDRNKPLDVADLDHIVPGPDPKYQTHGPGCTCGEVDCPWYRGEQAARIYRNLPRDVRQRVDQEFIEAMRSTTEWQMIDAANYARQRAIQE